MKAKVSYGTCKIAGLGMDFECPFCEVLVKSGERHKCHPLQQTINAPAKRKHKRKLAQERGMSKRKRGEKKDYYTLVPVMKHDLRALLFWAAIGISKSNSGAYADAPDIISCYATDVKLY